jgi:2-polyprenyl-3-methyl-5-hydroxy-6-metoxy-1,4-benzoquinol methylase
MEKTHQGIEYLSSVEEVSMHDSWFDIASADHFWLQWRLEIIKRFAEYLPAKTGKILEIGCGNGVVLNQFEDLGFQIDGCDLNEHALKMVKDFKGRLMVYNIYDRNPDLLEKYDCVFLLDVIEHIEDHQSFLEIALDYVKPGGALIVNVPAGAYLYGPYDKEVGHVRRYSEKELINLFTKAGLVNNSARYWAMSLVPFAIARKILHFFNNKNIIESGMKPPGNLAHSFLKKIKNSELKLIENPLFGASIMVAGRKG